MDTQCQTILLLSEPEVENFDKENFSWLKKRAGNRKCDCGSRVVRMNCHVSVCVLRR